MEAFLLPTEFIFIQIPNESIHNFFEHSLLLLLCGIRVYPGIQPFLGKVGAFLMKTEGLPVELNPLKNEE